MTIGKARMRVVYVKLLSAANKSAEITDINLPELVAMRDFMDRWQTLSKMTATRVLRIRIEVM